jgi:TolB-like protein/Flp pilus assembly protein TadD
VAEASHAVFLSYASQDAEAAKRICDALRAAGIEVWFDQSELRGGDAWDRSIRQQIRDCGLFLPIISQHTHERLEGYFRREWRLAIERAGDMAENKAFLVPVVVDGTPEQDPSVPERFRELQWTRLPGGVTPLEFVARVAALLGAPAPVGTAAIGPGPTLVSAVPPPTRNRPTVWLWLSLVSLAVIVAGGWFAFRYSDLRRPAEARVSAQSQPAVTAKSIAVLPFVDLSEKHDQDYFSDGLADELRDLLAQVPELRVPGRAASFYFKGRQAPLADIAKSLGVSHVLEGSVRKAGTKIRVGVELVRADTGYQLWSEHFDRDLKDIFEVQSEIASAVVQALKVRLLPQMLVSTRQTANIEAYDEYLLGRRLHSLGNADSEREAVAHFDRAIALDPNYAAAYAQRALAEGDVANYLGREITEEGNRRFTQDIDRAIALGPQMPDGYALRGLARLGTADWKGAREDLETAVNLSPQDGQAWRFLARYYASQRDLEKAIKTAGRAIDLDRFEPWVLLYRARFELAAGDPRSARLDLERALELSHGSPLVTVELALLDTADGAIGTAAVRAAANYTDNYAKPLDAVVRCARGERSSAVTALNQWLDGAQGLSLQYAIVAYVRCGENEKAVTVLDRYLSPPLHRISDDTVELVSYYAEFAPLRKMPRYQALLHKLNLPD